MFGLLGSSLRTLGAILGAALAALVNTEAVKSAKKKYPEYELPPLPCCLNF